jgi:hypothetical protein
VYESDWIARFVTFRSHGARRRRRVSANVWGLGVTSLLTDISSEMITSVLPAFLILSGGFGPLVFGLVDGLHHGATTLARWFGGVAADRLRRHKLTAAAGYGVSALTRLGWPVLSSSVSGMAGLVIVDRVGKAIRTAPRDALISLSSTPDQLGAAFGVHRALDAIGAAIGPVLTFAILLWLPRRFDVVFVTSFFAGVMGLAALALFVRDRDVAAGAVFGVPPTRTYVRSLISNARLRRLLIVAFLFGIVTVSDAFLYLMMARRSEAATPWLPLLYTGTSLAFVVLAVPLGRVADRVGARTIFVMSHVPLLFAYAVAAQRSVPWPWNAILCVCLLGTYYAGTDGVLAAVTSLVLPPEVRSTGLALVATATSGARLVSSVVFGLLWTQWNAQAGIAVFGGALAALVLAVWLSAWAAPERRMRPA